jgi:hypothetical protein
VEGWVDGGGEGKRRVKERGLFRSEEKRRRSGVKTKWVEYVSECPREDWAGYEVLIREEVLVEGVEQPWEEI